MEDMNLNNAKAITIHIKRQEDQEETGKFKIKQIHGDEDYSWIELTNGKQIRAQHSQDCCEHVYADFKAIDDLAYDYEFTEPLIFEAVEGYGFRFGNEGKMVSVPCYDYQNGYYSDRLTIEYDNETMIDNCELEHHFV